MIKNCHKIGFVFLCIGFSLLLIADNKSCVGQSKKSTIDSDRLTRSKICAAIKKYIIDVESCEPWQIKIECGWLPDHLPLIKPDIALRISSKKRGVFRGRSLFAVSFKDVRGKWENLQISCNVRRFNHVLVAAHRLDRHHLISGDEFRLERREITNSVSDVCSSFKTARGKRTKRIIPAGAILANAMIEDIPVVQRGDAVTALVCKKNLTISFPAKANQQGHIGDVITVRDMMSNRIVKAEVIDHSTVVIKM